MCKMKDFILLFLYLTTLRSTVAGTICLSCSGVETKEQCSHLETCRNDESNVCLGNVRILSIQKAVIQKRLNGFVDFYRSWDAYKQGFGDPAGEYWLGNDAIHKISSSTGHKLSIYMEDFDAKFVYANFSNFLIVDELENYQLTVTGFSGSPGVGDGLSSGNSFTTKDRDNDLYGGNCAQYEHGAWWYDYCGRSNLNGRYVAGFNNNVTSVFYLDWKKSFYSLKKVTMMIKRIRKVN
ncbi:ficolin-2-like isoform X2 [Mytilus galloprovincialis]|uniref:ficolin-2-like isoform X2 n=1 Tax=Mytilus galloprovincialis TaxID=29158 RepID=UPI003F7BC0C4